MGSQRRRGRITLPVRHHHAGPDTVNTDKRLIQSHLVELGLAGKDVAVHASLRSFDHVHGGAETVVRALLGVCNTVLMPTFCGIGRTNAPDGDRPKQNAWDYSSGGIGADRVTPFDPNLPLKRLADRDGYILLFGVGLSACTAVHLGEELAGRRPFVRWVLYADGKVRRVREYGCSEGFDKFTPYVEPLATRCAIGGCAVVCYHAKPFIEAIAQVIASQPEITLCGRPECRCMASLKGGPIEQVVVE